MHTVKELANLAGVSARTLHHYDDIGLLPPSRIGENSSRYYDEAALLRLQQILFYRELGLALEQIKEILDNPAFDLISALQAHREELEAKIARNKELIQTVDNTIMHLTGEVKMSKQTLFEGFSEEQQKEYELQAAEQWGEESVEQSVQRWNSYGKAKQKEIMAEGGQIYQAAADNIEAGPKSKEVQSILKRWHQHLRYFYEPSLETLRGLGNAYNEHPDFNATFTAIDPALPAFLQKAINHYVEELETRWLEQELGILEQEE